MNYRNTKLYKGLDHYTACSIAEGFCEGEGASIEDQLVAWQYISDTGIWKSLQGFYGRAVNDLIESGRIKAPKTN